MRDGLPSPTDAEFAAAEVVRLEQRLEWDRPAPPVTWSALRRWAALVGRLRDARLRLARHMAAGERLDMALNPAASADTARPPAPRRPDRPAAATTRPRRAPAGGSCPPCCGRSAEWPRSPGCSGRGRTSAGVHLESCAWTTFWATVLPPRSGISREVRRTAPYIRSSSTPPRPLDSCMLVSPARPTEGAPRWTTCVGIGGRHPSVRIPVDSDHRFRFIPITDSDSFRSPIPMDSDR